MCLHERERERIDSLKIECLPQLCSAAIKLLCIQYNYSRVSALLYLYVKHCVVQLRVVRGLEFFKDIPDFILFFTSNRDCRPGVISNSTLEANFGD